MFSVKGSTSKRSWLVYNSFLTTINETLKCEDDISLSYQSADSSQSKAVPPPPPLVVVRCALNFKTTNFILLICFLKVLNTAWIAV